MPLVDSLQRWDVKEANRTKFVIAPSSFFNGASNPAQIKILTCRCQLTRQQHTITLLSVAYNRLQSPLWHLR